MTMTEKQEISISKKTTVTLGLALAIVGSIAVGAVSYIQMRHADMEANRQGRELVLAEIRGLREEVRNDKTAIESRLSAIEQSTTRGWTTEMMEIWVLRSREAGELVDAAQIIERHNRR